MYDYLIVGSGLFGSTFANILQENGKKCLIIESRDHIGGNVHTEKHENIHVHQYGPHIFHTSNKDIWDYVNKFGEFNNFILSPKAFTKNKMYSLPFNMNTFYEVWGVTTPKDALDMINKQKFQGIPTNLEEQALSLVGDDIYNLLIKEYTQKQWKKHPKDLPSFIIKRLPLRFTYDNNYFNDTYQGIPINGYSDLIQNMIHGVEVRTNTNYFEQREYFDSIAKKVVFTGKIDEYFNYQFGELEYRTLEFQHTTHEIDNYQGVAIVNYPDINVPYTRTIEHKHFTKTKSDVTIVTKEIPTEYDKTKIPYYPINDERNQHMYNKYHILTKQTNVIFGGRLAEYQYYDMHMVIGSAMKKAKDELKLSI